MVQSKTIEIACSQMDQLLTVHETIKYLKSELDTQEEIYKTLLKEITTKPLKFKLNKSSKSAKGISERYVEGNVILYRRKKTIRTLRQDDFIEAYPKVLAKIGYVKLKDVDVAIGKEKATALCDVETVYQYSVDRLELEK